MQPASGWTTIDVPEIAHLPSAVFLRSQNLAAREVFPPHTHRWNQFVYATAGTLAVTVAGSRYAITPEQAIWVPTGVGHTTGALHGAAFRNLYVADSADLDMPARCTVYAVNGMLRALIAELERIGEQGEAADYVARVHALVLDQLRRLAPQDLHLPWPASPALQTLCEALYANPSDARGLEAWAAALGMSGRTLARRFDGELGLSLREWRHRLRLFLALEWLCSGRPVTDIALDLGYASTSAFTFMFRQEMGCPPSAWRPR